MRYKLKYQMKKRANTQVSEVSLCERRREMSMCWVG